MGRRAMAIVCGVAALLMAAAGCSSTNSGGGGAADAAAMAPGVQTAPDRYPAAVCAARGAKCIMASDTCAGVFSDVDCGPGMSCCIHETCKPDAAPWLIQASNYNVSCSVDSDCVAVEGFGDACRRCFGCPSAAINRSSEAQYHADVAKSPAADNACFCLQAPFGPCCVGGVCRLDDNLCSPPPVIRPRDGGSASTDATGDAAWETGAAAATDAAGDTSTE